MQHLTPADSYLVAQAEAWKRALCAHSTMGPMHSPGRIHKLLAEARTHEQHHACTSQG